MALKFLAEKTRQQSLNGISTQKKYDSTMRELSKLKVFNRILYVGAHPDDENNKLLTFFAQDQLADAAYLSLTRGEGGQNFIGAEKGSELGVLRVQESLSARETEGTRQFFTRAKDFGFVESADETMFIWNEQTVLADMVWTIRYFRPQVIITRFSPNIPDLHGHHQSSAILTERAYDLAADPEAFPEQLEELSVWKAQHLLWNVYRESGVKDIGGNVTPLPEYLALYMPVCNRYSGVHYGEIAAESRNKHRSQAMASLTQHTPSVEYFKLLKGEPVDTIALDSLFASPETSDQYIPVFKKLVDGLLMKHVYENNREFSLTIATILLWMNTVPANSAIQEKRGDLELLLLRSLGASFEVNSTDDRWVPGANVNLSLQVNIPKESDLILNSVTVPFFETVYHESYQLSQTERIEITGRLSHTINPSFPIWLKEEGDRGSYSPQSSGDIVLPQQDNPTVVKLQLQFAALSIAVTVPVLTNNKPVTISPAFTGAFETEIVVLADFTSRSISLEIQSNVATVETVNVRLTGAEGLELFPKEQTVVICGNASEKVNFQLTSLGHTERIQKLGFEIETVYGVHQNNIKSVSYPHIEEVVYYPKAELRVLNSSVASLASRIAYISGKNDELIASLKQLVNHLELIPPTALKDTDLSAFDAVILGFRIYNTDPYLVDFHGQLQEYIQAGGVLINQYNTPYDLSVAEVGPYPLSVSGERISDAKSAIHFLNPTHRILNYPNKIGQQDFDNWIQDRGLFFPKDWGKEFEPIVRTQNSDKGNEDGLLLVSKKGKGYYINSSLSLFRQLPAGVVGAYRLFANMLSIGS
ncbi:PIG-L family deacetylase [Sphingobacterium sp. DR205]|uniref:PIG-L family deacetylase n=1 Tax=Sphingobacterium sp. DR205 TaxID=2713573 RepID=UPI0013E4C450|nr:PIG-L family deacetylase [Sphingobacterium sp. DR205]QIH32957.1 PIG-L family deacetylase [Sphingobacterium sp. DR205]